MASQSPAETHHGEEPAISDVIKDEVGIYPEMQEAYRTIIEDGAGLSAPLMADYLKTVTLRSGIIAVRRSDLTGDDVAELLDECATRFRDEET